jgi:hypothetical protein|tara:strand:- start:1321 stop:2091 length:771 start_codon:yes stop_codon:yes gene_type:complete
MSNNKTSKTLLNEVQIRQFMKLAQLEPLSSGFIDERRETRPPGHAATSTHGRSDKPIPGTDLMAEEEDRAELEGDIAHDLGDDSLEGDDEALGDEEEMAAEEPAEDEGEDRTIQVKDFLSALERALEDVMGEEVEMDTSAMEDEDALDDAADMDMGAADMDMDMAVDDEDEEMLEEEKKQGADDREDERLGAKDGKESDKKQSMKDRRKEMRGARRADGESGDPVPTQESTEANDDLVEQITKRVAARILKAALKK